MLEGLPIMLALCFMLWYAYYAQNYAGIIDAGLVCTMLNPLSRLAIAILR